MRLRLDHFVVQPVLRWDDGETLTPGPPVQPQVLTLAQVPEMLAGFPDQLAALEAKALASVEPSEPKAD